VKTSNVAVIQTFATTLAVVLAATAAVATPITLTAPGDPSLNPGDQFRFLFVTSGSIDATSADIATYNSFVTAQAGGATYRGATVNWKAIASTDTVDARDNVGGFGTAVPVYLVNGTQVAADMTHDMSGLGDGLWNSDLFAAAGIGIDSTPVSSTVWSGSYYDGTKNSPDGLYPLGNADGSNFAITGRSGFAGGWVTISLASLATQYPMYGLSEALTVAPVPEPSSMALAAFGIAAAGLAAWRRKGRTSPVD
jgi:hypothetical protein